MANDLPRKIALLANGVSGNWDVSIDQTTSGPERWFAEIEGPNVSIRFEISSPDIVDKMILFLGGPDFHEIDRPRIFDRKNDTLVVGKDATNPVELRRDDEFEDRFFLVAGKVPSPVVWLTIAGMEVKMLREALNQADDDLEE